MKHFRKDERKPERLRAAAVLILCLLGAACLTFFFLWPKTQSQSQKQSRPLSADSPATPQEQREIGLASGASSLEIEPAKGSEASADLKAAAPASKTKRIVCLTFDDGPSTHTPQVLAILKKYSIPATFFLVGKNVELHPELVRQLKAEGHLPAVHTYNHDYKEIYSSAAAGIRDFEKTRELIYKVTGERPAFYRFPGGSVSRWNRGVRKAMAEKLTKEGLRFYDWNVSGADSAPRVTSADICGNITGGVLKRQVSVVLMHDTSKKTLEALEPIIIRLKKEGVEFRRLDQQIPQIAFYRVKPEKS